MVDGLFAILLFGSCAYACFEGGKEGRWVSFLIIAAAVLSVPASYLDYGWRRVQLPVLGVDVLLLLGLVTVALKSRRYWPLWMAGFHLVSIITHATRGIQSELPPIIYFVLQAFWSLPVLMVMVAGIMLDRRAGLAKNSAWKGLRNEQGRKL